MRVCAIESEALRPILKKPAVIAAFSCLAFFCTSSVVAADPDTERRVRFNEGIVAFNDRDYVKARRIFAELVRAVETDVGALYGLGLCQLQLNQYAAAGRSFDRVLQLEPDRLEVGPRRRGARVDLPGPRIECPASRRGVEPRELA